MKRFITILLTLACLLSLAACDKDSGAGNGSANADSPNNNSSNSQSQVMKPGGDNVVGDDGTLQIPLPDADVVCTVDAVVWQSLLAEDAIRSALKENSLTTITEEGKAQQYQMFYCAGGRYGCILKGNMYSETICGVQDGTVYVFNRSAEDGVWTRTTHSGSYDEYVAKSYYDGAMQFLTGIAATYDQAKYVETEKAYVIKDHKISVATDVALTGQLKVQFADNKLYSITLHLDVNGEKGTLSAVFGAVSNFDLPTDFKTENSNISVSPEHGNSHQEPPEAVCSESRWQRLFDEKLLINTLMDDHLTAKISIGQQEYLYQLGDPYSRIVISAGGSYEELLIDHSERFQRDSENGQWLRYSSKEHHSAYESIMNEKTAALTQLLTPLKELYKDADFHSASRCFTLKNVTFKHSTFGAASGEYAVTMGGGMIEEIKATIETDNGTVKLIISREKGEKIDLPKDYVDMDSDRPGKK